MAFCTHCGAKLEDGQAFCPSCGTKVGAENTAENTNSTANSSAKTDEFTQKATDALNNFGEKLTNTPNYNSEFTKEDADANKIISIFSYIGILFLIPLLAAPNSKFAKFHANQGLVLFIAEIIFGILAVIPILGWLVSIVGEVASLVFMVLGIINCVNGDAKELPFIGKYRIIK